MKKILMKFAESMLSKEQMKTVKGGGGDCKVCSNNYNGGGTCSPAQFSQAEVTDMVEDFLGMGDGYDYYGWCP